MAKLIDLTTLSKTSVVSADHLLVTNTTSRGSKKISVETLFPSLATLGTSSEALFASITNKNQLNLKGIKSGDTGLLTVTTASNNIVLTALEAGIDLSLCNNVTSGFLSGVDFTGTITGENSVVNGGTGLATIAKGAMLYASATDTIAATAAMSTNGQLLIGNATNGYPSVSTLTAGTGVTITNTAGAISIAATHANSEANIDMRNAADDTNYNIDLDANRSWISGDGSDEGITIDNDGKVFIGQDTPTAVLAETLNIKGSVRFLNTDAPTIKPTTTGDGAVGMAVTLEGGASTNSQAGHLNLNAGAASSTGTAGSVVVTAGQSTGGTDGTVQLKTYTSTSAITGLTVGAAGQDVTVNAGQLVITSGSSFSCYNKCTIRTY